jgi:HK97 gp10 family phage protein
MNVGISVSGLDAFAGNMDQWLADKIQQTDDAVQGAGLDCEGGAKQRAAVKTGQFRDGYQYENLGLCQSQVSNPVIYGPFLEWGTSRQPAQPSLFPAFAEASVKLEDDLKTIWNS